MPKHASPEQVVWARIKPRDERKGRKLRNWHTAFGMHFSEEQGWYIVPRYIDLVDGRRIDVADYLSRVRNDNENPDSPLAFDVMSEKEALQLDEKERKAAEERVRPKDARPVKAVEMVVARDREVAIKPSGSGDMTSSDLRRFREGTEEEETQPAMPVKRGRGRPRKNAVL